MSFFLDTNACIGLLRGNKPVLRTKLKMIGTASIAVPAIVRYELMHGACKSVHPVETLTRVRGFLDLFGHADFDSYAAEICAKLRASLESRGRMIGLHDIMIAAIVVANNGVLVSHNVAEFSRVEGLSLEDWEEQ